MSSPARRPANRPSRRQREQRAYRLTLATGGSAVATLAAIVLAVVNITSWGIAILLAVVTVLLGLGLKRSLDR